MSKRDRTASAISQHTSEAMHLVAAIGEGDPDFVHDVIEGETGLLEAIDAAIGEIDEADIVIEGCAAKIAQLSERKRKAEGRRERLRALIEQAMRTTGLDKIKLPTATLNVTMRPPAPLIADESAVPSRFWKQPPPVLDKAAINAAIKDGETVPGVSLSNGTTSLTIRRT